MQQVLIRAPAVAFAPQTYASELAAWVSYGLQPTNDLLWYIVTSNVQGIVGLSAAGTWNAVHAVQVWLWNFAPPDSYGSIAAARAWEEKGGQLGRAG